MRLISEADVDRLVDQRAAIEIAAEAFMRHSSQVLPAPGRLDIRRAEPRAGMLVLAGFSAGAHGIVKSNMHAYQGDPPLRRTASLLALWDMDACVPLALISSAAFNGHRTASGFAVGVRALARPDAHTLAVFGAGHMAAPSVRYVAAVRNLKRVLIKSRRREQAEQLAAALRGNGACPGIAIEATDDAGRAAAAADIIVCVTSADQPVMPGAAVREGTMIVLGGANRPAAREADDALVARARIYADDLAGCLAKAGDLRLPIAAGLVREADMAEIGALLSGRDTAPPRELAIFKSIGIAPQDLALATHILERATAMGLGIDYDPHSGAIGGRAK